MTDHSTFIKICGIRHAKDAEVAIAAGADALGFIFYRKSQRYIQPEDAALIISSLPTCPMTVGVFVDEDPNLMQDIGKRVGLDALQLHGHESPEMCHRITGFKVFKAIRVSVSQDLIGASDYLPLVDKILFDSHVPGEQGGTGIHFDHHWLRAVNHPYILAGGLNPDNVGTVMENLSPYGVDVSSGVEHAPGVKNHEKIRLFIEVVRQF